VEPTVQKGTPTTDTQVHSLVGGCDPGNSHDHRAFGAHPVRSLDVGGVLVKRRTLGKMVMCDNPDCSQKGQSKLITPLSIGDGLITWPLAICAECNFQVRFMHYVEGDVPE
jgi:hypothetical protein